MSMVDDGVAINGRYSLDGRPFEVLVVRIAHVFICVPVWSNPDTLIEDF